MKKRLLTAALTGLMAISTIMATPLVTNAQTYVADDNWSIAKPDTGLTDSAMPIVISTSSNYDNNLIYAEGYIMYSDDMIDNMIANATPDQLNDPDFMANINSRRGESFIYLEVSFQYFFDEGDVITIQLPISGNGEFSSIWYPDYWSVNMGTNSVGITCLDEASYFELSLAYALLKAQAPETNFWFQPMENELVIAASEVEVNGGTATAKISGDYALSYDIMKWLEDHPGVTLEYTLTYEGVEHLIVIPGGTQLANKEIPWYGPKYLIKYFEQR